VFTTPLSIEKGRINCSAQTGVTLVVITGLLGIYVWSHNLCMRDRIISGGMALWDVYGISGGGSWGGGGPNSGKKCSHNISSPVKTIRLMGLK
jgi:hypothetical protein